MSDRRKNGQLIAGVIILALGVALALESFSGLDVHGLFHLWPLIVIGIGVARLVGAETAKQRSGGLLLVALGCWFLINTLRIYGLDWGESWPLLLILLGISKLILPEDGRRSSGVLLLLIGVWTFINVFEIWGLYWENSWSIGLIIVGLYIVWKALFETAPAKTGETANG